VRPSPGSRAITDRNHAILLHPKDAAPHYGRGDSDGAIADFVGDSARSEARVRKGAH
jgi:hypothetical protein